MPMLNWYNIYSVNNEVIDGHHKKLIELFNDLYDNCLLKNDASYDRVVDELIAYAACHFAAEDQYMKELQYRGREQHVREHEAFTAKMQELKQVDPTHTNEACRELILFLGNWLLQHEIEEDRKYAAGAAAS